ncbi:MAG: GTP cyclohydrolase-2, partial [Bacteroidetes bacterium]|nr:GTP cyclohydrolase-2 [Bacteroidota bacterium]
MRPFSSVPSALKDITRGEFVVLVDDPDRENEGDFFIPAEKITPKKVNFLIKHGRGLVCVAVDSKQAARLALPLMVPSHENTENTKVNFAVSVNAKHNITSGISAFDRATTIQVLANPRSKPEDLTKPGHIFPLIAHEQGLAARQGHTEAAVTLAKLAGLNSAGVLCEIIKDNGKMARIPDLLKVAKKFNVRLLAITDLVQYVNTHPLRSVKVPSIVRTATAPLPTPYGVFQVFVYRSFIDNREHTALLLGDKINPLLARVHSQCLTGDTFCSLTCDCGEQLRES